jgi:hypothetical protein
MMGMGNDQSGATAWSLGAPLDIHYDYLVGFAGQGGWPDWNPNGGYVDNVITDAVAHGATPMFTLYQMAAWGDGNLSGLTNDAFMESYFSGVRLMYQRIAAHGVKTVVQLEPDFWGYAANASINGTTPVNIAAHAPECAGVTQDVRGFGQCLVKMARTIAPTAYVGFHFSAWGAPMSGLFSMFKACGSGQTDFITYDIIDRDVGCYEAHTQSDCQSGSSTTVTYWDETNATSPNFHDNEQLLGQITAGLDLPLLLWQVPFGVPSTTPGGTSGHYRDNRVHYIFNHVGEYASLGVVGAVFGVGAQNQTYLTTDNGQFKNATTSYFAAPVAIH